MRAIIAILCFSALSVLADQTNNITVIFTDEQDTQLRAAWRLKNYERTNALPALPALTFRQSLEAEASGAIVTRITSEMEAQREALLLQAFRSATEEKRLAIIKEALKP